MTNEEQKLREIVERWMGKKHPITMQSYVSDLTALISEKQAEYFEFVKWIGFESSRLYYRDLDEKWIRTIFIIDENPHEEYEEYTTDELFNYWKENVR